jgi:transcriptional regulator with XRE-family HTH domain
VTERGQMVANRGDSPVAGGARVVPGSVADIGRSLAQGRETAGLSLSDAARRTGLNVMELEALESGTADLLHYRVETLRALGAYANSLGLSGDDYVLAAVALWPAVSPGPANRHDTTVLPVVSVSSAPVGGHSPVSMWPGEATGVPDAFITRMVDPVPGQFGGDTGIVPAVTTGEVQAFRLATPTYLKVLIGLVALLVVLGVAGLVEHQHLSSWLHDSRTSVSRWYADAKSALGSGSSPGSHTAQTVAPTTTPKATASAITIKALPGGLAEDITVDAPSFTVKILAVNGACWVEATVPGQARAVFGQTLQAGQSHLFTVTKSLTIETGSSAGQALVYRGLTQIGHITPTRVPFHMNFSTAT